MLDDLRNSAESSFKEEPQSKSMGRKRKQTKRFMGMTAPQRFLIAFMLLVLVVVLGTMCLLITAKVILP